METKIFSKTIKSNAISTIDLNLVDYILMPVVSDIIGNIIHGAALEKTKLVKGSVEWEEFLLSDRISASFNQSDVLLDNEVLIRFHIDRDDIFILTDDGLIINICYTSDYTYFEEDLLTQEELIKLDNATFVDICKTVQ